MTTLMMSLATHSHLLSGLCMKYWRRTPYVIVDGDEEVDSGADRDTVGMGLDADVVGGLLLLFLLLEVMVRVVLFGDVRIARRVHVLAGNVLHDDKRQF